jgi:hypothetical protein
MRGERFIIPRCALISTRELLRIRSLAMADKRCSCVVITACSDAGRSKAKEMESSIVAAVAGALLIGAWTFARLRDRQVIAALITRFAIGVVRVLAWIATVGHSGASPLAALMPTKDEDPSDSFIVSEPSPIGTDAKRGSELLREYDFVVIGGGAAGLSALETLCREASTSSTRPTSILLVVEGPRGLGDDGIISSGLPPELSALRLPGYTLHAKHPKYGRTVAERAPAAPDGSNAGGVVATVLTKRTELLGRGLDGSTAASDAAFSTLEPHEWATLLADADADVAAAVAVQHRVLVGGGAPPQPTISGSSTSASGGKMERAIVPSWPVVFRSPLSWAFAKAARGYQFSQQQQPERNEAAGTVAAATDEAVEDDVTAPKHESVEFTPMRARWNPGAGMAKDRISYSMLRHVAQTSDRKLVTVHVICNASVNSLKSKDAHGPVQVVTVEAKTAKVPVRVARAVIVAAGIHRSVNLSPVDPDTGRTSQDALVVPLIYQARQGVSLDAVNAQTLFAVLRHAALNPNVAQEMVDAQMQLRQLVQQQEQQEPGAVTLMPDAIMMKPPGDLGLIATPMLDGYATVRLALPDDDAGTKEEAHVAYVELLPAGGFNREMFEAQRWSPTLGVFKEAFTFRITVPPVPAGARGPADVALARQQAVAVQALRWCRRVVATAEPLCFLTTGREALDVASFGQAVPRDAFKLLYGKPPKARTAAARTALQQRAGEVFRLVRQLAEADEYLGAYVSAHGLHTCVHKTPVAFGADNVFDGTRSCFRADTEPALALLSRPGVRLALDVAAGDWAARRAWSS